VHATRVTVIGVKGNEAGLGMAEGWRDFYLLIGSAGGALIGLLFVVMTLTVGRDRQTIRHGRRLYTSPIVFHLSMVLMLSGAAMAPMVTASGFALLCGIVAAVGSVVGIRITIGIRRAPDGSGGLDDICWYGVAPTIVYLLLLGAAIALAEDRAWGALGVGGLLMGLLLLCIHNAWDLVTWLAPTAGTDPSADPERANRPSEEAAKSQTEPS